MTENNGQTVYKKFIDKNNNIIYARTTEDQGIEYFTLIQFAQKQVNDVTVEAFENIKQDHNLQEIGTTNIQEIMDKL